ncbi:hypothetical protein AN1V17_21140 [Vallitalea sediminicola]
MNIDSYILRHSGSMMPQIIIHIVTIVISIGMIILSVYLLILLIKLAKRGIKALDIYIKNNGK